MLRKLLKYTLGLPILLFISIIVLYIAIIEYVAHILVWMITGRRPDICINNLNDLKDMWLD